MLESIVEVVKQLFVVVVDIHVPHQFAEVLRTQDLVGSIQQRLPHLILEKGYIGDLRFSGYDQRRHRLCARGPLVRAFVQFHTEQIVDGLGCTVVDVTLRPVLVLVCLQFAILRAHRLQLAMAILLLAALT